MQELFWLLYNISNSSMGIFCFVADSVRNRKRFGKCHMADAIDWRGNSLLPYDEPKAFRVLHCQAKEKEIIFFFLF